MNQNTAKSSAPTLPPTHSKPECRNRPGPIFLTDPALVLPWTQDGFRQNILCYHGSVLKAQSYLIAEYSEIISYRPHPCENIKTVM